jgi:hypothetical protein
VCGYAGEASFGRSSLRISLLPSSLIDRSVTLPIFSYLEALPYAFCGLIWLSQNSVRANDYGRIQEGHNIS